MALGAIWCTWRPRRSAISWGRRNAFRADIVACTMLMGFDDPIDFDRMSLIPAASITARTGPPAITPVPGDAGFSSTRPAPSTPMISCGIVEPIIGTTIMWRLASSTPFWIAAGTSLAFPWPTPTRPALSPTTTSAVNENRRPPLTTLATRLMCTTRSS